MNYARAIRRFLWIVLFGVAMAGLTGLLLLFKVDRAWPPKLSKRAQLSYVASTQLLVDSPSGPYLQTAVSKGPTGLRSAKKLTVSANPVA